MPICVSVALVTAVHTLFWAFLPLQLGLVIPLGLLTFVIVASAWIYGRFNTAVSYSFSAVAFLIGLFLIGWTIAVMVMTIFRFAAEISWLQNCLLLVNNCSSYYIGSCFFDYLDILFTVTLQVALFTVMLRFTSLYCF